MPALVAALDLPSRKSTKHSNQKRCDQSEAVATTLSLSNVSSDVTLFLCLCLHAFCLFRNRDQISDFLTNPRKRHFQGYVLFCTLENLDQIELHLFL